MSERATKKAVTNRINIVINQYDDHLVMRSGCICGFFDRGTVCSTNSSGTDPALALITDTLKLFQNVHKLGVAALL